MTKSTIVIGVALLVGCSRPDRVRTFPSSMKGLYYTVEEHYAGGRASDTDLVIAHLERDGKSSKMLVLEGGDLTVNAVRWNSQNDVTLCIGGGTTNIYRNEVTLFSGEFSVTVRNHLDENCGDGGNTPSQRK